MTAARRPRRGRTRRRRHATGRPRCSRSGRKDGRSCVQSPGWSSSARRRGCAPQPRCRSPRSRCRRRASRGQDDQVQALNTRAQPATTRPWPPRRTTTASRATATGCGPPVAGPCRPAARRSRPRRPPCPGRARPADGVVRASHRLHEGCPCGGEALLQARRAPVAGAFLGLIRCEEKHRPRARQAVAAAEHVPVRSPDRAAVGQRVGKALVNCGAHWHAAAEVDIHRRLVGQGGGYVVVTEHLVIAAERARERDVARRREPDDLHRIGCAAPQCEAERGAVGGLA